METIEHVPPREDEGQQRKAKNGDLSGRDAKSPTPDHFAPAPPDIAVDDVSIPGSLVIDSSLFGAKVRSEP